MTRTALRARLVCPVAAPPIEDAIVVLDGDRIERIGRQLPSDCDVEDLGDVALMPGFVNATATSSSAAWAAKSAATASTCRTGSAKSSRSDPTPRRSAKRSLRGWRKAFSTGSPRSRRFAAPRPRPTTSRAPAPGCSCSRSRSASRKLGRSRPSTPRRTGSKNSGRCSAPATPTATATPPLRSTGTRPTGTQRTANPTATRTATTRPTASASV